MTEFKQGDLVEFVEGILTHSLSDKYGKGPHRLTKVRNVPFKSRRGVGHKQWVWIGSEMFSGALVRKVG